MNSKKLTPPVYIFFGGLLVWGAHSLAAEEFRGNRKPGILADASDTPTGPNAEIYQRLGRMTPPEMLELVSEPVERIDREN